MFSAKASIIMRILLPLFSALFLSACVSSPLSTIGESEDGQVVLGLSHIGEDYESVMARAALSYDVEPQCEERKVSLRKQRKAFLYEICGFTPENTLFSDAQLSEVVYHFIGRDLVRVDLRAEGETALLDSVKKDMATIFGSSKSTQSTLGKDSYQWIAKQHVAGVRAGTGGSAGNIHVRLLDGTLTENAPWLAAE